MSPCMLTLNWRFRQRKQGLCTWGNTPSVDLEICGKLKSAGKNKQKYSWGFAWFWHGQALVLSIVFMLKCQVRTAGRGEHTHTETERLCHHNIDLWTVTRTTWSGAVTEGHVRAWPLQAAWLCHCKCFLEEDIRVIHKVGEEEPKAGYSLDTLPVHHRDRHAHIHTYGQFGIPASPGFDETVMALPPGRPPAPLGSSHSQWKGAWSKRGWGGHIIFRLWIPRWTPSGPRYASKRLQYYTRDENTPDRCSRSHPPVTRKISSCLGQSETTLHEVLMTWFSGTAPAVWASLWRWKCASYPGWMIYCWYTHQTLWLNGTTTQCSSQERCSRTRLCPTNSPVPWMQLSSNTGKKWRSTFRTHQ